MSDLNGYKFSNDHEWVKAEGENAYVGLSDYAQDALGDIVFVELPNVGARVEAGVEFGSVESVKAVSEMCSPVTGLIIAVNTALNDAPELLNENPYENWLITVQLENPEELETLMSLQDYEAFCAKE